MPQYEFENTETGELRDFAYTMADAPSIGSTVKRDGGQWLRIPPQPTIAETHFTPFASMSRCRYDKRHKGKFTKEGRPIFSSKKSKDEYIARHEGRVAWD